MGIRASLENLKTDPETIGAELEEANRGGDITFHGPGQLVGYPLLKLEGKRGGGMADTAAYVHEIENLLIETCKDLGIEDTGRIERYPGVWVNPNGPEPRKIAAIGVRLNKARTMHGFALNVNPDMAFYDHIVPCGITEYDVTSLEKEGINTTMKEVVDLISEKAEKLWSQRKAIRADVLWGHETNGDKTLTQIDLDQTAKRRKPEWMKVKLETGPEYRRLKKLMEEKQLVTVCEEAGCPNIFDCWNDGTATFMIGGERCTRACGFCLVDTRKPNPLDMHEPQRVAAAVSEMGLRHAVVTSVARDDLKDGGAEHFAITINVIRERNPETKIEVLIPDFKGNPESLNTIFEAQPDVLNHNIETVPRLQRQVRPSAGYARSLSVLARANKANLITKTSLIVGLGEQESEIDECLVDLAAIGCDIVTIGQYLRPSPQHLPIKAWVNPSAFKRWKKIGENLGISHVEASPLTRSSYHARQALESTSSMPVSIGRPQLVLADS
jgi:lipoic acid synthetase